MQLLEKLKEAVLSRAVEASAASMLVIAGFLANDIVLPLLPYIESAVSKKSMLSLLALSLFANIALLALIFLLTRRSQFVLKYGIYWDKDKNPHCPSCKTPVATYNEYSSGKGYFCKPCKKLFPLADASGNDISPEQAINEL